jgi:hypothetical protein
MRNVLKDIPHGYEIEVALQGGLLEYRLLNMCVATQRFHRPPELCLRWFQADYTPPGFAHQPQKCA